MKLTHVSKTPLFFIHTILFIFDMQSGTIFHTNKRSECLDGGFIEHKDIAEVLRDHLRLNAERGNEWGKGNENAALETIDRLVSGFKRCEKADVVSFSAGSGK